MSRELIMAALTKDIEKNTEAISGLRDNFHELDKMSAVFENNQKRLERRFDSIDENICSIQKSVSSILKEHEKRSRLGNFVFQNFRYLAPAALFLGALSWEVLRHYFHAKGYI